MDVGSSVEVLRAACKAIVVPTTVEKLRETRKKGEVLQTLLRKHCRYSLDIQIRPILHVDSDEYLVLNTEELTQAYNRRRLHLIGRQAILHWAANCCADQDRVVETPRVGIAFWHPDCPGDDTRRMPDMCVEAIETAVVLSGLTVHLFAYHAIENCPAGVHQHDPSTIVSTEFAEQCVQARGIAFLSCYICAKLLLVGFSGVTPGGGWIIDARTIWLRQAPRLIMSDPQTLGHFFGSLAADPDKAECDKYWLLQYLTQQG